MDKYASKLTTNILRTVATLSVLLLLLTACSTKKDRFLNRNWQALNTKYNVMYNGDLAYEKGIEEIRQKYHDNFWEILPIERMTPKPEQVALGEQPQLNANFQRAEEKATKAIQKRSMNIGGRERNSQIDEAHLLLGKARYYDNRFVPALEAFNYILYKYPESDKIYEAKIWRERTNMRLDNDQVAVNNLTKLLKDIQFKDQVYADANATLAQAYLNLEQRDSALVRLKRAHDFTEINEEKARYSFILGQLYDSFAEQDSAQVYYQRVIDMKRKSPRRYIIEAHARQARHFDYVKGDTLAFKEKYRKLLEDRENRPYLDMLHHQMALYYDARKDYKNATVQFNRSIEKRSEDNYLTASNYRNLAQIKFNTAKYQDAGLYYDSTMTYLDPKTREFKAIKKKRDNLADVIKYEAIAQRNDSILNITGLSVADRRSFYEDYIVKLKKADEAKAKLEKERQERLERENRDDDVIERADGKSVAAAGMDADAKNRVAPPRSAAGASAGNSTFYFYNPQTVAYGKLEFRKKWGSRTRKPNWRLSAAKASEERGNDILADTAATAPVAGKNDKEVEAIPEKYTAEFYLKRLPTQPKVLDSLAQERNFAYYQLGVIYKEKFREYQLASDKLEQLLQNRPEERLVLPSYYHLYKIYEITDKAKAAAMKDRILREYPDSRYAQILSNPTEAITGSQSPEATYDRLFDQYEQGDYRSLLPQIEAAIEQFTGEEIVPKMELLKARTAGKLKGFKEYKAILNFTALQYPNTEEGKEAERLLGRDVVMMEGKKYYASKPESWKILYQVPAGETSDTKKLDDLLKKFTSERTTEKLKRSRDLFTMEDDFLVIHGIPSEQKARDIATILRDYKEYQVKQEAVVISNENYIILQMRKDLEEYLKTPPSDPLPEPAYVPERPLAQPKDNLPGKRQDKSREPVKSGGTRPPGAPMVPNDKDDPTPAVQKGALQQPKAGGEIQKGKQSQPTKRP